MKQTKLILFTLALFTLNALVYAQEALPIYSDYLTDNYYLLHPSMAGAANCTKARITARQQWFGDSDAPRLLTANASGRVGDSSSGVGAILFADKNGYHSQNAGFLTYAQHLMFSRNETDLNMLSLGLSAGLIQYKLNETTFLSETYDPIIVGIVQSATNFNVDIGLSYHVFDFYVHATIKNLLKNDGINFNEGGFKYDNLRTFVGTIGGNFSTGNGRDWLIEPSALIVHRDATKETFFDANLKAYKYVDFGKAWGGISYRRFLDGALYLDGDNPTSQKSQYFSPFFGVNLNQFMFAYTYSYQANNVNFNGSGFHQITLGVDLNCAPARLKCHCPAVN